MVDDNRFKEIVITIIDSDGKEIDTERHQNESTHPQVFTRIEQEQIPGLFENYKLDVRRSSGFELAGFVAANNYCVFCPTNINNDKQMILFLPKVPTHEQCEKVKEILSKMRGSELYAMVCSFKKRNSPTVLSTSLSSSDGDFMKTYTKIIQYLDKVEMLDSMLTDKETKETNIEEVSRNNPKQG